MSFIPIVRTAHRHPILTPVLIVADCAGLLAFIRDAFGGQEAGERYPGEQPGTIGHAEIRINDALIMACDPMAGFPPTAARLFLYVVDVQQTYDRAIGLGATALTPPEASPDHGMVTARIQDAWGNYWSLAQAL